VKSAERRPENIFLEIPPQIMRAGRRRLFSAVAG